MAAGSRRDPRTARLTGGRTVGSMSVPGWIRERSWGGDATDSGFTPPRQSIGILADTFGQLSAGQADAAPTACRPRTNISTGIFSTGNDLLETALKPLKKERFTASWMMPVFLRFRQRPRSLTDPVFVPFSSSFLLK